VDCGPNLVTPRVAFQGHRFVPVEHEQRLTTASRVPDQPGAPAPFGASAPTASTPDSLVAVCVMGCFGGAPTNRGPNGGDLRVDPALFSNNGGNAFVAGPGLGRLGNYFGEVVSPAPGVVLASGYGRFQDLDASGHTRSRGQVCKSLPAQAAGRASVGPVLRADHTAPASVVCHTTGSPKWMSGGAYVSVVEV